jgi:DNA-binding response OmpR family regulator
MTAQHEKPLNILLVEDDDGDAKAVQRAFLKTGIANSILRAVDGIEALDMLRGLNGKTRTPSPRILITDLNLPRMNGVQLIREIRENKDIKSSIVFILTTSKREEDKVAVYDLNVAGYIAKATLGEDFQELVRLVDCYRRLVELPS